MYRPGNTKMYKNKGYVVGIIPTSPSKFIPLLIIVIFVALQKVGLVHSLPYSDILSLTLVVHQSISGPR